MSIFSAKGLTIPDTLTQERCESFLPRLETDPEWKRKSDAGLLPAGLSGMCGMLDTIWPDEKPTDEEARFILAMSERGTMRWLGAQLLDDDNQIGAMHLIEAAQRVIAESTAD